ncbi:CPSF A subunit region-domain-containing protein [Phlyctochytrium arcticum]|nr:CPSF A subunit region-domain-containing protein [Phlyctochytrium arcticum]
MSSIFSLYKPLLPPSSIDACVQARFTHPESVNLIVARGSVLQVYGVIEGEQGDLESSSSGPPSIPEAEPDQDAPPKTIAKLELVAEFHLHGNITSMGVVRTVTSVGAVGMDSLLLSFRDAKMSLIEYSPATHDIVTVSIHYYEREEFKRESITSKFRPDIRVDPQNRCAVMQFYNDRLAILPFKMEGEGGEGEDENSDHPFHPSFVIPFTAIDSRVRNVVDMTFLHGYFEPTLAILFEPVSTWAGRLAARKDTKALLVVSLDLTQRNYPVLFKVDHLPYNCHQLLAAPSPVGGVVILSPNAILHIDQTSVPGMACAVNGYYGLESHFPTPPASEMIGQAFDAKNPLYDPSHVSDFKHLGISLDGCSPFFLNPDTMLLILKSGELVVVDMEGSEDVGRGASRRKGGVKRISVKRTGLKSTIPGCGVRLEHIGTAARLGGSAAAGSTTTNPTATSGMTRKDAGWEALHYGYLFVGSKAADAALIQFVERQVWVDDPVDLPPEGSAVDAMAEEDNAMQGVTEQDHEDTMDEDELDEDIYGTAPTHHPSPSSPSSHLTPSTSHHLSTATQARHLETRLTFRIVDTLLCTGPIRDMAVGTPTCYSKYPFRSQTLKADLEIVTCAGEAYSGALGVLQENVRPLVVEEWEIEGVVDIWTVGKGKWVADVGLDADGVKLEEVKIEHEADEGDTTKQEEETDEKTRESTTADPVRQSQADRFLLISKETSTVVLAAGNDYKEVEGLGFYRDGPTIGADVLLDGQMIVQVYAQGIEVLDADGMSIENIPFPEEDGNIVACSILDPYVLIISNTGGMILYAVNLEQKSLYLCRKLTDGPVAAACLYTDDGDKTLCPTVEEAADSSTVRTTASREKRYSIAQTDANPVGDQVTQEMVNESAKRRRTVVPDDEFDVDLYGVEDGDDDTNGESTNGASIAGDKDDMEDVAVNGDSTLDGGSSMNGIAITKAINHDNQQSSSSSYFDSQTSESQSGKRVWCVAYRSDGALEIFHVPTFEQVYRVAHFDMLATLIHDELHPLPQQQPSLPQTTITEILMVNLGRDAKNRKPYLIVQTDDGELVIYKGFAHLQTDDETTTTTDATQFSNLATTTSTTPKLFSANSKENFFAQTGDVKPNRLALRFIRVPHSHMSREATSSKQNSGGIASPRTDTARPRRCLKPFYSMGLPGALTYSGVFVAGPRPCWIMVGGSGGQGPQLGVMSEQDDEPSTGGDMKIRVPPPPVFPEPPVTVSGKNVVRVHPQLVDGGVVTFAQLHSEQVDRAFMYVTAEGRMRVGHLPAHFNFDAPWPICKVPIQRTPQKITYHHSTQTYIVASSTPVPFKLSKAQHAAAIAAGVLEAGDPLPETEATKKQDERDKGMYWPQISAYSLEIISPVTWETVDAIEMDEYEHILAIEAVELESKQTTTGRKSFLALGTGVVRGEDLATRGRIVVYDIIDIVPEPEHPFAKNRFKQLYVSEEKGPVTALCNVGGHLVAAIGTKVIVYAFEDSESLTGIAFLDVNMYVNSLSSIKNLIMVGDIMKSVWLLGFQEEPPKLALLGKDFHALSVYGCEFLVDDSSLALVVGDSESNVHVMTYSPYHIQSSSGQKLIRRGDFHVGQHISKMLSLRRIANDVNTRDQQVTLIGTMEGGVSLLVPVSEKLYKRLYSLYSKMVNNLQHPAGLNPRGYRHVSAHARPSTAATATPMTGPPGPRLVLDGQMLYRYASLSVAQQKELAKGIGSISGRILDDLLEGIAGVEYF